MSLAQLPAKAFRFAAMIGLVFVAMLSRRQESAAAEPQDEVARLSNAALSAQGPNVYASLRELFGLWDVTDPRRVESAIAAYAESPKTSPAGRVYAQVLLATARARRGDSSGAAQKMSQLGFIHQWLFVGPFDDENRIGLPMPYQPELELGDPIVPGRAFDGKERPVRWRATPPEHASIVFDFGEWLRPREKICGYVAAVLRAKEGTKPRKITLYAGVEGSFRMFFNGVKVNEDLSYRGFDFDRSGVIVDLVDGPNRLTLKVCNDTLAPRVAVRIADEKGAPDLNVLVSNDPAATEGGAAAPAPNNKPSAATTKKPAEPQRVGPIDVFEKTVASDAAPAAALEAYSRYLVATNGDPIGEHVARDLATKAATKEPNWERAINAARLVEDRNQARTWIERAVELAPEDDRRAQIEILLAQGHLGRSGPNWRDATPFYDKALALDSDNVFAIVGRAELYMAAGLPRTALAILESAIERHPSCPGLLRIYAAQLRDVGRDAEADDAEARWFAYRGDDAAFIQRQVERASARGDTAAAERWITRLEGASSNLVFTKSVAARAYRSLGQNVRAQRALESALDVAPEDASTLRSLADLAGEQGERDTQLRFLRRVLLFYPQDKEVRAYVEHLSPTQPRQDESYAWDKDAIAAAAAKPVDKAARTRILRKLLVTTVYENGLASRFYQIVFQPLTDEAAAEARQYITQYEADRQEIELRLSRVYRRDGTVAEAMESGEAAANDPSIAMYTSVRAFFVTFPRIGKGDVVELRYRIDDISARNEVADSFYDVEYLQESDPIAESELILVSPKNKKLTTFVANLTGATESSSEQGDQKIQRFTWKDVPSFVSEPGQPARSELIGQIHISTFQSWNEVGKWYWNLVREQLDVDETVRAKAREITANATDEASKVRAIYHYVTNLRYVALEFGLEGIKPRRCALTIARGWGDCKDKATVIVTMLRELGIAANLVLVRTGMRGDLAKGAPPSLGVFDHAIAYVPSLDIYLDGTAEGSGSTELPEMDRDSVGLRINEDGTATPVRLPNPGAEASPQHRKLDITLAADGGATFTYDLTAAGVSAPARRARYHNETTRKDRAAEDLPVVLGPVQIASAQDVTVRDADDVEKPFSMSARGKAPQFARREGDVLSVPVAMAFRLRSAAALSSRKTDLVLGAPATYTEERTIRIPAGAKVERGPENVSASSPFGRVDVSVKIEGNQIVITSKLTISVSRVTPADYAAFRTFCERVDTALEQRLIVKP